MAPQKASTSCRDKSWCHVQWSHSLSPAIQLSLTFRGTSLNISWFFPCLARVGELSLAEVNCFSGYPHHGFDLFVHILIPPTLQLDFWSSTECLCLCFHQLLDEGSEVIFKIFISLITGPCQFALLLRVLHGVILVDYWEFL